MFSSSRKDPNSTHISAPESKKNIDNTLLINFVEKKGREYSRKKPIMILIKIHMFVTEIE